MLNRSKLIFTLTLVVFFPAVLFGQKEVDQAATPVNANSDTSWPQLRGSNQGHAAEGIKLPSKWSDQKNVAWKTEIPGSGWSSPTVDSG